MIYPSKNRILIKPDTGEAVSKGGIILPNNEDKQLQTGTIIETGTDVKEFTKNQKVVYKKYAGNDIAEDGQKYLICEIEDVLGVVG